MSYNVGDSEKRLYPVLFPIDGWILVSFDVYCQPAVASEGPLSAYAGLSYVVGNYTLRSRPFHLLGLHSIAIDPGVFAESTGGSSTNAMIRAGWPLLRHCSVGWDN